MGYSRINISSQSPWEPLRGYSRAVVIGDRMLISGTTSLNSKGEVVGINDPYLQTKSIIDFAKEVLQSQGFALKDVIYTRLHVTDIKQWQKYAKAHSEAFDGIRPASSIVEVQALVDPRLMIEIEFEAHKGAVTVDFTKV